MEGAPAAPERTPQKKRVLVMLGARMTSPNGPKGWNFPLFTPTQQNSGTELPGEVSGGSSRMRAIESAYKGQTEGKDTVVLVTGGKDSSGASKSEEAARQLVSRYGLPGEDVVSITGKGSTQGNAAAAMDYIRTHEAELGTVKEVGVVTNDYHMLRAWLMFSQAMLKLTAGKEFAASTEDIEHVKRILAEGSPEKAGWTPEMVRKTREKAMAVLAPYFSESKIRVMPEVVEETLEEDGVSRERYARLLRENEWVRKTIPFEQQGVVDLLEGKYKGT